MYNDEASKYRVLSHNTAMINYYGCVLIQQIFGLYRVPVYIFFPRIFALLSGNIQVYRSKAKIFQAKRIFIKFDRTIFFTFAQKEKRQRI